MKVNSFNYKSLLLNLKHSRGSNLSLPQVASIKVEFGPKDSTYGALSSFCVNELPRIYYSNNQIKFDVNQSSNSQITIKLLDGAEKKLDLTGIISTAMIYDQFTKSLGLDIANKEI
jgi:hypothetical protein